MRRFLFALPFALGAVAVIWIGATFLRNPVALTVTLLIAAVYGLGFLELLRYRRDTARLDQQLQQLPEPDAGRESLTRWLTDLPGTLRHAVQRRVDGQPAALPGPVLTPYLTGLLVMLGLLGTFVGMIVTLKGAATALDGSSELTAIRSALSAPIAGLSLAFGTSIAGVAASAMLGLTATLCRRDRMDVSRQLDDAVDGQLYRFSLNHQREAAYAALQSQSQVFPELVTALQTLTGRMEQMGEQLTGNQQAFHNGLQEQYQGLARSVGDSLRDTLADSSRLAAESVQPIMAQSLASLSEQVQGTHEKLNAITEQQLGTLTERFRDTTEHAAEQWRAGLAEHQQTSARLVNDISTSLAAHHDQFQHNSNTLLQQVRDTQQQLGSASEQQLASITGEFQTATRQALQDWNAGLEAHRASGADLLEQLQSSQQAVAEHSEKQFAAIAGQFQASTEQAAQHWQTGLGEQQRTVATLVSEIRSALHEHNSEFRDSAAGLLSGQQIGMDSLITQLGEQLNALRDQEAARGDAASERLAGLEATVTEHLGRLGTALEAPMTRLIETASETPKAAAEVITRLREEMTHSSERDNELLEERRRIMAELDTLLTGQQAAAGAQRDAIDTLIRTSGETLSQVSDTFSQQVSDQASRLNQVAGDVTGSAAEVASLSDAFAAAVQVFSSANDTLLDNLQQVETSLEKSSARADEQLGYYVEQAREVIELSMASQKDVIDALASLRHSEAPAQDGQRPASEVN